jgi:hypothetical protein
MGIYTTISVEPYLEIKRKGIWKKLVKYQCSEHPDNKYKDDDKFCSLCGNEIKKVSLDWEYPETWFDLFNLKLIDI